MAANSAYVINRAHAGIAGGIALALMLVLAVSWRSAVSACQTAHQELAEAQRAKQQAENEAKLLAERAREERLAREAAESKAQKMEQEANEARAAKEEIHAKAVGNEDTIKNLQAQLLLLKNEKEKIEAERNKAHEECDALAKRLEAIAAKKEGEEKAAAAVAAAEANKAAAATDAARKKAEEIAKEKAALQREMDKLRGDLNQAEKARKKAEEEAKAAKEELDKVVKTKNELLRQIALLRSGVGTTTIPGGGKGEGH